MLQQFALNVSCRHDSELGGFPGEQHSLRLGSALLFTWQTPTAVCSAGSGDLTSMLLPGGHLRKLRAVGTERMELSSAALLCSALCTGTVKKKLFVAV